MIAGIRQHTQNDHHICTRQKTYSWRKVLSPSNIYLPSFVVDPILRPAACEALRRQLVGDLLRETGATSHIRDLPSNVISRDAFCAFVRMPRCKMRNSATYAQRRAESVRMGIAKRHAAGGQ